MPKLQLKSNQEIQRDLINHIVARTALSDVSDSSTIRHFISAVASNIGSVYYQFTRLADMFDFQRAAGTDLDERATEILGGTIARRGARRAVGQLTFARAVATVQPVTIPVGTLVTNGSGVSVVTTETVTILANETSVIADARAEDTGAAGNVGPSTLIVFQGKPSGVDTVTNNASFSQGADIETDDAFRERILEAVGSLARSTPDALEFVVKGIEDPGGSGKQITFAHVFEDPQAPGTAVIYVDDGTGAIATDASVTGIAFSGTDVAFSAPDGSGKQTITLSFATTVQAGTYFTVGSATDSENVGSFLITDVDSSTVFRVSNAGGVASASAPTTGITGELLTLGLNGPPTNSAVGGEEFLSLDNKPVLLGTPILYKLTNSGTWSLLSSSQYNINYASGLVYFTTPLSAGDKVIAHYEYYTGVIQEAQKVVDGDPEDRLNYPGWRAAGINVRVLPPTVVQQAVTAFVTVLEGYERSAIITNVESSVSNYINNLGISGDVIRSEVIEQIMGVDGVYDVNLVAPAANVIIKDDELPRIDSANIDIQ